MCESIVLLLLSLNKQTGSSTRVTCGAPWPKVNLPLKPDELGSTLVFVRCLWALAVSSHFQESLRRSNPQQGSHVKMKSRRLFGLFWSRLLGEKPETRRPAALGAGGATPHRKRAYSWESTARVGGRHSSKPASVAVRSYALHILISWSTVPCLNLKPTYVPEHACMYNVCMHAVSFATAVVLKANQSIATSRSVCRGGCGTVALAWVLLLQYYTLREYCDPSFF